MRRIEAKKKYFIVFILLRVFASKIGFECGISKNFILYYLYPQLIDIL